MGKSLYRIYPDPNQKYSQKTTEEFDDALKVFPHSLLNYLLPDRAARADEVPAKSTKDSIVVRVVTKLSKVRTSMGVKRCADDLGLSQEPLTH